MRWVDAFYRDLFGWQTRYDYGERTDGQAVYMGRARMGVTEAASSWMMVFYIYNEDGNVVETYSLEGVWNDRATLFASYAV